MKVRPERTRGATGPDSSRSISVIVYEKARDHHGRAQARSKRANFRIVDTAEGRRKNIHAYEMWCSSDGGQRFLPPGGVGGYMRLG